MKSNKIIKDVKGKGNNKIKITGGGALVSCSTSTPINHIIFFFSRIPVVLENRRSSQGGGGVCAPLHPPPRSAPGLSLQTKKSALGMLVSPSYDSYSRIILHSFLPSEDEKVLGE